MRSSPSRCRTAAPRPAARAARVRVTAQSVVGTISSSTSPTVPVRRVGLAAALEPAQRALERRLEILARHDHVDHAVLEQELRALEARRQLLADRLLDHARPGEADQRIGLGDDDVAEHRDRGRDAAGRRMQQHRDVRHARLAQLASAPPRSSPSASATARPPACARRPTRENMIAGRLCATARSNWRVIFSPTTEPIEPPMNSNTKKPTSTGMPPTAAVPARYASPGPTLRVAPLT